MFRTYNFFVLYTQKMPDKPSRNSVKICATQTEWRTGWATILRESKNNIERGCIFPSLLSKNISPITVYQEATKISCCEVKLLQFRVSSVYSG